MPGITPHHTGLLSREMVYLRTARFRFAYDEEFLLQTLHRRNQLSRGVQECGSLGMYLIMHVMHKSFFPFPRHVIARLSSKLSDGICVIYISEGLSTLCCPTVNSF